MFRVSGSARNCHGVGLRLGTATPAAGGLSDQSCEQAAGHEKPHHSALLGIVATESGPQYCKAQNGQPRERLLCRTVVVERQESERCSGTDCQLSAGFAIGVESNGGRTKRARG